MIHRIDKIRGRWPKGRIYVKFVKYYRLGFYKSTKK